MNLDELKVRVREVAPYVWLGQTVYLRKVGARDAADLHRRIGEAVQAVKEGSHDLAATVEYHAGLVSKSVADESGNLVWDSDDGRETLRQLPTTDLFALGDMVLSHNGYTDEKKS